jgi:thioredoxin-related protein
MFRPFLGAVLLLSVAAQTRPPAGYDPTRDPARDLAAAIEQATKENKRILLVVGGEWCGWCHVLENYVKANADVQAAWTASFVTVKVNWSQENTNKDFLSRYPQVEAYPYFFVLEKDGTLLAAQRTGPLESGSTYSKEKMMAFILKWKR